MKIIKAVLKKALESQGYSVVKNVPIKPVIYNAYFRGGCLKCYKGDPLCEEILTGLGWDEQLEEIISEATQKYPERVCVEIGANIGAGFITLAKKFPETTFDCYEPVPRFFQLLTVNRESYKAENTNIFNKALSHKEGEEIQIAIGLGTAGRPETEGKIETLTLRTETLNGLYLAKEVALLKLDVDGYELAVLKGALEILKKSRPYVFMEFDTKLMKTVGEDPLEIISLFEGNQYSSVKIWDNFSKFIKEEKDLKKVIEVADEMPHYANVLFVP